MIALLDQKTINQIAAGEVIERPSSVVKELVENSVDSGASAITVEIKEGGLSFIRITDNGSGIPKEEVRQAFLRHATSKITRAEDLLHISSR
ncbi:MAG: ATP-binding protein, partial [Lachnospiraceae bacterium]|nr:ATP-binding protein [Lachnospiraceae bacterium]